MCQRELVAEYCTAWHVPLVAQHSCWHWPRVLTLNCAKPQFQAKSAKTREPKEHVGAVDPDAPWAMPMSRATGMATFMGGMLLASENDV